MNSRATRAYNELVNTLLEGEDREKFEWAIGAMLCDGPRHPVVLIGPSASGKTTLTRIIGKILMTPAGSGQGHLVRFAEWDRQDIPRFENEMELFLFVEANTAEAISDDSIVVRTTGRQVSVHKHYVLMREIGDEAPDIANQCISLYHSQGDDYYDAFQENNR